jgi:pimeloyl-ACP methyl ester carboxylesterase
MRFPILAALMLVAVATAEAQRGATPSSSATPSRFEAKDGVNLSYVVKGSGEPVVLIHGLYSSVRRSWEAPGTLDLLAEHYQVIALDLPGHGNSDKPDTVDDYGVAMVDDVVKLLDHLKIKKAHIVGYSMGGMITMKLMAKHSDRVLSAVVGGMGWMPEGTFLAEIFARLQGGARGPTPAACLQSLGKLALSDDELRSIHLPVTVVIGANDPVKTLFVEPLRIARPDWPIVDVPNANHSQCLLRPEFKQAITEALKKSLSDW